MRRTTIRAAVIAVAALTASAAFAADFNAPNIGKVQQPLWYHPPSERTLKLAKIDDLSHTVVSKGEHGEEGVLASNIKLTPEQIEKIRKGKFTAAIAMGWLGDDWATQQLLGLKATFEKLGIKVVAETNANWDDAKQITDLDAISVLHPNLLVSIPLNPKTTASAYKKIADAGTKVVFMDQSVAGMKPGDKNYVSIVSSDNLALGMYIADELAKALKDKGQVGAMYFANDFYVTNLRYIGFLARLAVKYPNLKLVVTAGHDNPNKGQEVASAMLARYPNLDGLYGSWSIPAMGAATAARFAGRTPQDFAIVNENFDQIVAKSIAENGFIKGLASQRPYDQGTTEATVGALALIGDQPPAYVVVPPLKVDRDNLAQAYKTIYRRELPADLQQALAKK